VAVENGLEEKMVKTMTRRGAVSRRIATMAVAVTAAAGFTVAVAAPAQANTHHCQEYLAYKGYVVGPKVQKACDAGASGQAGSGLVCYVALAAIGVARDHATYACSEAAK
jgi:hypothetical protein